MAAPVYATDLTDITTSETVTGWAALGGGQSGLNDETDYFIQGSQCVSKNGFTASTRGQIFSAGATTIAAGDAVFFWIKQNNRNLMDTVANGGTQALIGSGTGAFDRFYVDGSDSQGSTLAGWRTYAVDPTATPSAITGSPSGTTHFGAQWAILGSGSLKGAPNGIDAIRHGRELQCTEGDPSNGYATFDGAATFDNNTTRAWGLLTPIAGGYQFHGLFAFGTASTAVDFRDSNRNIVILDDPFVGVDFNTFDVRNASSNIALTSISIQALGTASPGRWVTTDNAIVSKTGCTFTDMGAFSYGTNTTLTGTTYRRCGTVTQAGATVSGGLIDASSATTAFVMDDFSTVSDIALNGNNIAIDATAAIVSDTVDLDGVTFSGNTTDVTVNSANDITINNLNGANATTCTNAGAGICTIQTSVTITLTNLAAGSRVYIENTTNAVVLYNELEATSTFSRTLNYTADKGLLVRVRNASGTTKYKAFQTTGTLTAAGFSLTVNQELDE